MKRSRHPSYFRVLVTASLLILGVGVSSVVSSAVTTRKQIVSELDRKLDVRARKILLLSQFRLDYLSEIYEYDFDEYEEDVQIVDYLSSVVVSDEANDESEPGMKETPEFRMFRDSDIILEDQEGEMIPIDLLGFSDEAGDRIYYWKGYLLKSVRGYFYERYIFRVEGDDDAEFFYSMNTYSFEDTEMTQAAESLIKEGEPFGWHGNYRYCNFAIYEGNNGGYETRFLQDLPSTADDDITWEETDGKYFFESYSQYIIFEDASEVLANWRTWTRNNALVMLGGWSVLTCLLAVFLHFLLKPKRNTHWIEIGEDGLAADDENPKLVSGLPEEEPSIELIPEDLAAELLSLVSRSESSLGSNGYLEQLKDAVGMRRKS
ncbi:MAG: hypothetical protein IK020_00455 [Clostridiales bacterium]|nr:hypothetical protein [Clostridiales bacterium]